MPKGESLFDTQTAETWSLNDAARSRYSLVKLCYHIENDPVIARSFVVAFRCFSQIKFGIVYRFIVLELDGDAMTHRWLRFDRQPSRAAHLAKIVTVGAPADDSVSPDSLTSYTE